MHLKSYQIDGRLLRTGAANFSASGLKRQDNDLIIIESTDAAAAFRRNFDGQFAKGETLRSGKFSAAWTLACTGCGCRGGPGYRGPDGKCVGWQNIEAVFELSDVERFVWI
jgi:PLD-like domain